MLKTLSFQRLQLGEENDWVWGRWYWCREGAAPLEYWTCYGSQVWEDHRTPEVRGPKMPLAPAVRASPALSPYSGVAPHGQLIWYQEGLPLEERNVFPGNNQCGAQKDYGDVTVGLVGAGAEQVEFIGRGLIQYSLGGMGQTIAVIAGDPGDLLVGVARNSGDQRGVVWPAGWNYYAEGYDTPDNNITWTVAWRFADTGTAETLPWSGLSDPTWVGFTARYRNAGQPYAIAFQQGRGPVFDFPSVQLPVGFAPSMLWACLRFVNLDAGLQIAGCYKVHEWVSNASQLQAWGRDLVFGEFSPTIQLLTDDEQHGTTLSIPIPLAGSDYPVVKDYGVVGDGDGGHAVTGVALPLQPIGGDEDGGAAFPP